MVLGALTQRETRYNGYIPLTFSQYLHFMLLTWRNDYKVTTGDAVDRKTKPTRLERELLYRPQLNPKYARNENGKNNNNNNDHAAIQTSMKVDN